MVQHWRDRATEARSLAAQIDDPVAKLAMLTIAENYNQIAERAAARALGSEPSTPGLNDPVGLQDRCAQRRHHRLVGEPGVHRSLL